MARFILISPIVGAPPGGPYKKWGTGTTLADTAGNAIGNDIVWPSVCASAGQGFLPGPAPATALAPLDAAAQALMPGSTIVTIAQMAAGTTVRNAWGVGLDAGD
jgi:hypothetical protein